jgi:Ring hydroxylating beta subunit
VTTTIDPGVLATFQAAGPVPLELRVAVQDFLIEEAELLDSRRFEEWLALFTDDVEYRVPVRTTRRLGNPDVVEDIFHFDENKMSLGRGPALAHPALRHQHQGLLGRTRRRTRGTQLPAALPQPR